MEQKERKIPKEFEELAKIREETDHSKREKVKNKTKKIIN